MVKFTAKMWNFHGKCRSWYNFTVANTWYRTKASLPRYFDRTMAHWSHGIPQSMGNHRLVRQYKLNLIRKNFKVKARNDLPQRQDRISSHVPSVSQPLIFLDLCRPRAHFWLQIQNGLLAPSFSPSSIRVNWRIKLCALSN